MKKLLPIIAIFLLVSLLSISARPLYKDEALYAVTAEEFIHSPSLLPTFLAKPFFWKPPFFFYSISPLTALFSLLPIPLEIAYRLPSIFFGLLSLLAFNLLAKKWFDEETAYLATLIYSGIGLLAIVNTMLLIDPFLQLLILLSLLAYSNKNFPLAFLLSLLAFLTKLFPSFLIPLLAFAYFLFTDRQTLKKPAFLLSLTGVLAGLLLHILLYASQGQLAGVLAEYSFDLSRPALFKAGLLASLLEAFLYAFAYTAPWSIFFLPLLIKASSIKSIDSFLLLWLLIAILPSTGSFQLFWYLLPFAPPIAMLAARGILPDKKFDRISQIFFLALLIFSFYILTQIQLPRDLGASERELGTYLHDKVSVRILANYSPTLLFYEFHNSQKPTNLQFAFFTNSTKLLEEPNPCSVITGSSLPSNSSLGFHEHFNELFTTRDALVDGNWNSPYEWLALDPHIYDSLPQCFANFTVAHQTSAYIILRRT